MNHVYNRKHQNRVTLGKLAWKALKNPGSDLTSPEGETANHSLVPPPAWRHTPSCWGDVAQVTVATWRRRGGENKNEKHERESSHQVTYLNHPLKGGTIPGPPPPT